MFASAYGPYATGSGGAAYRSCYFALPANYDQLPFRVDFGFAQSAASATIRLTIDDGSSTDTAVTTVTASSGVDSVSVRPSSTSASSTPRYGYLDLTAASGQTLTVTSIFVWLIPEAAGTGVRTSGYISVGATWYAANAPIPSEILETLQNNTTKIAMDRPTAIYSMVLPTEAGDRGRFTTSSTDLVPITKIVIPPVNNLKTWRVWCYVERTSDAKADVIFFLGTKAITMLNSFGIMTTTFQAGQFDLNGEGPGNNLVTLRVSEGSGSVALRTLQIIEEPT